MSTGFSIFFNFYFIISRFLLFSVIISFYLIFNLNFIFEKSCENEEKT